jgi:release factor family 12
MKSTNKLSALPPLGSFVRQGGARMDKAVIRQGDWVVVCDGRKALILENQGDEKYPNLRKRESHDPDRPFQRRRTVNPAAGALVADV